MVVGRTLRPVERIRAEVAASASTSSTVGCPSRGGDDEIARLAVTMNEMLDRLERSVRRQQRFVADASHELRTPLTRMRAELEVDERDPAGADAAATRRSLLEEIAALQRLIDDLLVLARSDAGRARRGDRAGRPRRHRARGDPSVEPPAITVDASRCRPPRSSATPTSSRRVVRNLLDNARRHATHDRRRSSSPSATARPTLVVADDGPGIPPERRADVFERFARLDEARTGGAGRAGLGLAIVHDIVTRHGGSITVEDSPSGGARFVITMPTR